MNYINLQVPSALYVDVYKIFGEKTEKEIIGALQSLAKSSTELEGKPSWRPGKNTKTGRVWEIADQFKERDGTAARIEVVEACIEEGINMNTASTQFSHWKNENL